MAEFCLECWNEMNEDANQKNQGNHKKQKKYILSKNLELCEGCAEWKRVVVTEETFYHRYKLYYFTLPFKIINRTLHFLFRLLTTPYSIYKYNKRKEK